MVRGDPLECPALLALASDPLVLALGGPQQDQQGQEQQRDHVGREGDKALHGVDGLVRSRCTGPRGPRTCSAFQASHNTKIP